MALSDIFRRRSQPQGSDAPAAGLTQSLLSRLARLPRWGLLIVGIMLFAFVYWGIVGAVLSNTKADLTLRPSADMLPPGGSVAIATAARLIDDAINEKGWTPNDSLLRPTALLEDMPAFQRGQHDVLLAFAGALDQEIDGDPELAAAAAALRTPPDRGMVHGGFPFIGGSAESNYTAAVEALTRYNRAIGDGGVPFGNARQLRLVMIAIDRALARKAIAVDEMVDDGSAGSADVQYHDVRGAAYAATMLMRGLREDFEPLVRERQLASSWAEVTEALDVVAVNEPFGVDRGDLVEQGYYLLRARGALRALSAGAAR